MESLQAFLVPEDIYFFPALDVILVPENWAHMPRSDQEQLYKILAALKRAPETVRVIKAVSWEGLPDHDQPAQAVLFAPGFDEKLEIQSRGTTRCLHAPPLAALADNKELKQKLWAALQNLFGRLGGENEVKSARF